MIKFYVGWSKVGCQRFFFYVEEMWAALSSEVAGTVYEEEY